MARYIDPKVFLAFYKVFGEHTDLLINFLNCALPLPSDGKIESLTYLSIDSLPVTHENRDVFLFVRCLDRNGRSFIVKIQMAWVNSLNKMTRLSSNKAEIFPVEKDTELKSEYSLNLVDEEAFPDSPDTFYHVFKLLSAENKEQSMNDTVLIFIELPKFRRLYELGKCGMSRMSLWLRFLTEINDKTRVVSAELTKDEYISKAISLVDESSYSEPELYAVDRYWDSVSIERTLYSDKYAEGMAAGMAEVMAEAMAKGRAEARAEIIQRLIEAKFPLEKIVKVTGLTEEEILKLGSKK